MADPIIYTQPPRVTFGLQNLAPPTELYVAPEDYLRVNAWSSIASAGVQLTWKLLLPNGSISSGLREVPSNSDRSLFSSDYRLTEGWLLSVIVNTTNPMDRGRVYVTVQLRRGDPAGGNIGYHALIQQYISFISIASWPGRAYEDAFSGRGFVRQFEGTNPAAGAEISETVPTNALWRFISLRTTLVNSAAVGSRFPRLVFDDGSEVFAEHLIGITTVALDTTVLCWAAGASQQGAGGLSATAGVANDLWLPEGYRVRTLTSGLQAGDDYNAPQLLVEEWLRE